MALVATFVLVAVPSSPASAKSYRFTHVSIDATVRPDGSLQLVERRTFAFHGSFTAADYTVDWPSASIGDLTVREGEVPVSIDVQRRPDSVTASWSFHARDEERTWTIAYTAACAVRVYTDAAHLLWRFVGRWGAPTDEVDVTIHLPEVAKRVPRRPGSCPAASTGSVATRPLRAGEVRAWGHGPYAGHVEIVDPSTVRLQVPGLRGDQYVEGSVLFPPAAVPFAHAKDRAAFDDIVAVERRLAEQANEARRKEEERKRRQAEAAKRAEEAARRRAEAEAERRARAARASWLAIVVLALLGPSLILVGRLRDRVAGVPPILREPPDDMHPVQLAMLWSAYRGDHGAKNAYRAQLLHLATMGAIELSPVGTVSDPSDLVVRRTKEPAPEGVDADFLAFLFPEGAPDTVQLSALSGDGTRGSAFRRWWADVGSKSRAGVERIGQGRVRGVTTIAALSAVLAVVFGSAVLLEGVIAGLILGAAGVAMLLVVLRFTRPRLPSELRTRMARWGAFRRFLGDFSSLPEAPALAVVIWEHYLVYAVALDVADEVRSQVRALTPPEELPAPWPGAPVGADGLAWLTRFQAALPIFAAPTPVMAHGVAGAPEAAGLFGTSGHASWAAGGFGHMSSGAGFGGGFSGGGGGFGGGLGGGGGGGTHGGAH